MLTLKNLRFNKFFEVPSSVRSRIRTVSDVSSDDANDRRVHTRIRSYNLLRYSTSSGEENNWLSNLKDISEGGVQFNARHQLQKDATLKLLINVAEANRQIEVMAKTVWTHCEKVRGNVIHHVGAAFLNINELDRMIIRNLALSTA